MLVKATIEHPAHGRTPTQHLHLTAGSRFVRGAYIGEHQDPHPGRDVAPLRDIATAVAAERRTAWCPPELDPCDPWPEQRIGYGDPTSTRMSDARLPSARALEALQRYLDQTYPR